MVFIVYFHKPQKNDLHFLIDLLKFFIYSIYSSVLDSHFYLGDSLSMAFSAYLVLSHVIYHILPVKNTLHITISKLENKVDPDQLASDDKFMLLQKICLF